MPEPALTHRPTTSRLGSVLVAFGLAVTLAGCGQPPQVTASQAAPASSATRRPPSPALFTNTASIGIPDLGPASPSTITVSGVTGTVTRVGVTLYGVSHGYAGDMNVLLVGPTGQTLLLMSDTAGEGTLNGTTLTFDDAASPLPLWAEAPASGAYRPTDYDSFPGDAGYDDDRGGYFDLFPSPAPAGPYGSTLGGFNTLAPNGTWSLYVVDDNPGDGGRIAGGWSLSLTTGSPAPH